MDRVIFSASADEIMDSLERNCGINVYGRSIKKQGLMEINTGVSISN